MGRGKAWVNHLDSSLIASKAEALPDLQLYKLMTLKKAWTLLKPAFCIFLCFAPLKKTLFPGPGEKLKTKGLEYIVGTTL